LLEAIQQRIWNQNITVNLLRVLKNSADRFLELVVLTEKHESTQEPEEDEFKETFQDTINLLERFEEERKELQLFFQINFILENGKSLKLRRSMTFSPGCNLA